MDKKKPALGKGLSALIPDATASAEMPRATLEVDIDQLEANRYQPRTHYDGDRLTDLANSITSSGIIQPIVVRRISGQTGAVRPRYQIIAGERRWRAAQQAGLARVPVTIKDVDEGQHQAQLEMALIENIQRENLNPLEEALAYQRLVDEFRLTQEDIGVRVGKDRATVANILRLLRLPQEVRDAIAGGALSMGHARALLSLATDAEQRRVARQVMDRGLSVRDTEALTRRSASPSNPASQPPAVPTKDVHTREAEQQLRFALGTAVTIHRRRKGGSIEVGFSNEQELQRLYEYLMARR
ncbi:MAG: ParB/RepB/Spo0J family partition protein [Acidobacteria bacterium]|nr:ParB/RepB/Spo0J family partition protein [Acidobacteriota bacterium]